MCISCGGDPAVPISLAGSSTEAACTCPDRHYGGFNSSSALDDGAHMACTDCGDPAAIGPSPVPWVPPGCECLGIDRTLELLESVPSKHSIEDFGPFYGSYCAAWEDGKCSDDPPDESPSSLFPYRNGPDHICGDLQGCDDLWPSYDFTADQAWCCAAWCYVDRATCTDEVAAAHGLQVLPSWLNVEGLYYSYEVCKDDQNGPANVPFDVRYAYLKADASYATYTVATCPYVAGAGPLVVSEDKHVTGEEACQGKGLTEEQCVEVGCCQWDSDTSACHSGIGTDKCMSPWNACACQPGFFGDFDDADPPVFTCAVRRARACA